MLTWRNISRRFLLFVVFGGVNTLVTYGIYVGLVLIVPYAIAYSVSYLVGIILSYYTSARFVFRERLRWSKALQYPVVYIVQYLIGLIMLFFLVNLLGASKFLAPCFVVLVTVPATYCLARVVLTSARSGNK